jgi:hypothetical protein
VSAIGQHYTTYYWSFMMRIVNLRPAGPLGESGGPSVEKGGESDVESRHL